MSLTPSGSALALAPAPAPAPAQAQAQAQAQAPAPEASPEALSAAVTGPALSGSRQFRVVLSTQKPLNPINSNPPRQEDAGTLDDRLLVIGKPLASLQAKGQADLKRRLGTF